MKKVVLIGALLLGVGGSGSWYVYSRPTTRHCVLLFGRQGGLKVWASVTDQKMSLAREGSDGQLIPIGRFKHVDDCRDVELIGPDGKTTYVIERVSQMNGALVRPRIHLFVNVAVKGPLSYRQYCDVELAHERGEARIAHFDGRLAAGPKTINWKVPTDLVLKTGHEPSELMAVIGTMDAARGCWVAVRTHEFDEKQTSVFPAGVFPTVDVEFPPREPGAAPVRERYYLDKFC